MSPRWGSGVVLVRFSLFYNEVVPAGTALWRAPNARGAGPVTRPPRCASPGTRRGRPAQTAPENGLAMPLVPVRLAARWKPRRHSSIGRDVTANEDRRWGRWAERPD
jgi:hypothetical protein